MFLFTVDLILIGFLIFLLKTSKECFKKSLFVKGKRSFESIYFYGLREEGSLYLLLNWN